MIWGRHCERTCERRTTIIIILVKNYLYRVYGNAPVPVRTVRTYYRYTVQCIQYVQVRTRTGVRSVCLIALATLYLRRVGMYWYLRTVSTKRKQRERKCDANHAGGRIFKYVVVRVQTPFCRGSRVPAAWELDYRFYGSTRRYVIGSSRHQYSLNTSITWIKPQGTRIQDTHHPRESLRQKKPKQQNISAMHFLFFGQKGGSCWSHHFQPPSRTHAKKPPSCNLSHTCFFQFSIELSSFHTVWLLFCSLLEGSHIWIELRSVGSDALMVSKAFTKTTKRV